MRKKSKKMLAIALGAAGAGAGLMFLFDPNRGGRRRRFIGDKAVHGAKFFGRNLEGRSRDMGNRAQGVVAGASARLGRETVADHALAERVRSKIGRVVKRPRTIDVTAERGIVELRGTVLRSEKSRAIRCAESVRGVRAVQHDALMTYSDEQSMPGFQPRSGPREWKQSRPGRKMRKLRLGFALVSGAVAAYRAFKRSERQQQRRSEPAATASGSDIAA